MLFNSITYLIFLPCVAVIYWRVPHKFRHVVLLIASYVFYMSWMKIYGLLLFGLTAVNFLAGVLLSRVQTHRNKRLIFTAGLAVNLGCLGLFKYTNLIIDTLRELGSLFSRITHLPDNLFNISELPIILPLGISFFVFEFIHYLVDVFKGEKAITCPLRFGLFAAFFPSQIAGPIKRFEEFDRQVILPKKFDKALCTSGVNLILQGLFKKVVLGDNLAPVVQVGFASPQLLSTFDAWVCVIAFAWQIYFDFSGYTDIGRGSAMVLGYTLPENFNLPYIATSLRDFWHRWHISLSTWLRDYLYIPLGGSRKGKSSAAVNSLITMLLGGLWHGAAWHFVVWGAYQGVGLALNRVIDALFAKNKALTAFAGTRTGTVISCVGTFIIVCLGWVLFRASNLGEAGAMYHAMFVPCSSTTPEATITELILQSTVPVGALLYVALLLAVRLRKHFMTRLPLPVQRVSLPGYARAIALVGYGLLLLGLAPQKAVPFIYFQF